MRLLVIGQTGQVATSLAKLCLAAKADALCAGRNVCDITDYDRLVELVADYRPDAVINGAAYTAVDKAESDPETCFAVNARGAGNVAAAAAKHGVPILHISTDYVFSGDKRSPYLETDPTSPKGIYGASKLEGEKLVAQKHPNPLILRTAWVFSDTGQNFVKTMLRLAGERERIGVVKDQIGNPTDADEIATALLKAADTMVKAEENTEFGLFNFCGPETMSWARFSRLVFEISQASGGPGAVVDDIPSSQYPTPAKRPANSSLECEKFFNVFGYRHIDLNDALKRCVSSLLAKA